MARAGSGIIRVNEAEDEKQKNKNIGGGGGRAAMQFVGDARDNRVLCRELSLRSVVRAGMRRVRVRVRVRARSRVRDH